MLTVAHILNFALMILIPLVIGVWLTKRFGLPWSLLGWGALTFIASQILHIPFNQFLLVPRIVGLGFSESVSGLWVGSLLLGLSAGLFEELARYIFLRRWVSQARSWRSGLLYGLGHGGVEAIILGCLALFGFVQAAALRQADLSQVLAGDRVALAEQQLAAYWSMSPWLALLGATERVFALLVQISAALMVIASIVREDRRWLLAAVLWHTAVDAVAVFIMQRINVYAAETAVFVMATLALVFIVWVRHSDLLPVEVTGSDDPEELRPGSTRLKNQGDLDRFGEELERSRYE